MHLKRTRQCGAGTAPAAGFCGIQGSSTAPGKARQADRQSKGQEALSIGANWWLPVVLDETRLLQHNKYQQWPGLQHRRQARPTSAPNTHQLILFCSRQWHSWAAVRHVHNALVSALHHIPCRRRQASHAATLHLRWSPLNMLGWGKALPLATPAHLPSLPTANWPAAHAHLCTR
jgi:hypothetical protein